MAIPSRTKLAEYFAQLQRIEETRSKKAEREIRKLYKEMLTDLQSFLGVEYAKYADDDALTYATLAQKGEYARFLEQVQAKVNGITPKVNRAITSAVQDTYRTAYEGMVKAVSKAANDEELAKLLNGIHLTQAQVIKAAVNNPVAKLTLPKTLEKSRKQIVYNIKNTVTVGIMNGDRMSTMARKIQNDVEQNYRKAMLIARTEVHRVRETGHNDATASIDKKLVEADSEYRMVKKWMSVRDSKVRKTSLADHRAMHGKMVLQDEDFDLGRGVTAPCPSQTGKAYHDCNCRCYVSHDLLSDEEFFKATGRHFPKAENKGKQAAVNVEDTPEKKQSEFVPAKTLEEAEEFAQKFVSKYKSKYSGIVSFNGMDTDHANMVNHALSAVFDAYDIDVLDNVTVMNFREKTWKTAVEDGVAAAFQWGGGGKLFINQKLIGTAKTESAFVKKAKDLLKTVLDGASSLLSKAGLKPVQQKYIAALVKSGRQCVSQSIDGFTESTIVHEMGHMLDFKIFGKQFKSLSNPDGLDIAESMEKYASGVSGYATSSKKEYIAESFTAYWYGMTDILDPELVAVFERMRKR